MWLLAADSIRVFPTSWTRMENTRTKSAPESSPKGPVRYPLDEILRQLLCHLKALREPHFDARAKAACCHSLACRLTFRSLHIS